MSPRDAILNKIRRSLTATGNEMSRRSIVIARLEGAPRSVIPERGQLPPAERVALFAKLAEKNAATVARVDATADVPRAVADYLRGRNLPAAIRTGDDPLLAGLPWGATQIEVSRGASEGNDSATVSHAMAGIAETGTLVLASGPDNPTTLNFLPEAHIVVLRAGDIAGDMETTFDRLRETYGKGVLPRTVNMVTGPSRSADIEQTILLGAHGPRSLHIIVVG